MSEDRPTPAEDRAEAAKVRRRWLTLGELLAVAAVVISALTLWNNWSQRHDDEVKATSSAEKETREAATIALGGAADNGGTRLSITSLRGNQAIQGQTIRFPRALGLGAVETTGDARIEADWLRDPVLKALKAAKVDPAGAGDRRLPVLVTTRFWSDGKVLTSVGLYDVGYSFSAGGLLDRPDLRLTGLSFIQPAPAKGAAERLETLWKARV